MPFLTSFFKIIYYLKLAFPGKQKLTQQDTFNWVFKALQLALGPQKYSAHFLKAQSLEVVASKPMLQTNSVLFSPWPALASEWPHGDGLHAGEINCIQKGKD